MYCKQNSITLKIETVGNNNIKWLGDLFENSFPNNSRITINHQPLFCELYI